MRDMLRLQIKKIQAPFKKSAQCIERSNNISFYGNLHEFVSRKSLRHIVEEEEDERVRLEESKK